MGLVVSSTTANFTSGEIVTGATLLITVVYSGSTTVTGTPRMSLSNGTFATYTSGSGSANIVFKYIVGAADLATTDINAASSTAINRLVAKVCGLFRPPVRGTGPICRAFQNGMNPASMFTSPAMIDVLV